MRPIDNALRDRRLRESLHQSPPTMTDHEQISLAGVN